MAILATMLALVFPAAQEQEHEKERSKAVASSCRATCHKWRVVRPFNWKLNRIAWCESTGRWHIATGNGFYGGLQFTLGTWYSVGGRGMPHLNSVLEQKYRAVKVYKRRGSWVDWPVCGYS